MTQTKAAKKPAEARVRDLSLMFSPRSIAVVGASTKPGTVGNDITRNLVFGGFNGVVYPINPKAKSILGIRCVPSVPDLEEGVDLAVIIVPATSVEGIVKAAADQGTRNFVVISAGFKEVGGDGVAREKRLAALANEPRPVHRRPQLPRHHQHRPRRPHERRLRPGDAS